MENQQNFKNSNVEQVFASFPESVGKRLLFLRNLIFEVASENFSVGEIEESLKWGQPSYVPNNKSGSPIRLGAEKKTLDQYGLYVNCNTSLIETFKHIYPSKFTYGGNRSVLFETNSELDTEAMKHIIDIALTYHKKK